MTVVRLNFANGRYEYLGDVCDVDDQSMMGTNSRGRSILVRHDLVRATTHAG